MLGNNEKEPRSVLITGTSSGIGAACALDLDQRGFRVFAGVRKQADANRLRGQSSERLVPVLIDVTDDESIRAAVETVSAAVGNAGLAGLVNNAGINVPGVHTENSIGPIRHRIFAPPGLRWCPARPSFLASAHLKRGDVAVCSIPNQAARA